MVALKDITIVCPACENRHNLRDWLHDCMEQGLAVMDDEYTQVSLMRGRARLRYVGVHCMCGKDFTVEIGDGEVEVFNNGELWNRKLYEVR